MKGKRTILLILFALTLVSIFITVSCRKAGALTKDNTSTESIHVSRAKGYTSLSDLVTDSPVIAIGKVTRIHSEVQENKILYITSFIFQPETVFKGDIKGEMIIRQSGTSDAPWAVVDDDPLFKTGERYLLFLNANPDGTYFYYGPCARYKIQNDKVFSMNYILTKDPVYKAPEQLNFNGVGLTGLSKMITETLNSVRFVSPSFIKLLSGETGKIETVLANGKYGEDKAIYEISRVDNMINGKPMEMPKGMEITIQPSEFNTTIPYSDFRSVITIKTDEQIILPGDYWILVKYDIGGKVSGEHLLTINIDATKLSITKSGREK
jgi:hypothetical protein